jgi:hypothetical protein
MTQQRVQKMGAMDLIITIVTQNKRRTGCKTRNRNLLIIVCKRGSRGRSRRPCVVRNMLTRNGHLDITDQSQCIRNPRLQGAMMGNAGPRQQLGEQRGRVRKIEAGESAREYMAEEWGFSMESLKSP